MKYNYVIVVSLVACCFSLENGLGRTPQMGWSSWNKFSCKISEDLIKQTADLMVTSGLSKMGYTYLNLDDCWHVGREKKSGKIRVDGQKFPSGMGGLAKYIHSKGLKFGLYSDAGYKTCAGRPGSLGFEAIDAKTFNEWEVDYLKYDNCFNSNASPKTRYTAMAHELHKLKRPIFLSMCEWGRDAPHEWARELANSWRTTQDIQDTWISFLGILDQQAGLEDFAGPGGWNDPDMLEVGNGGMSDGEYQSQFALWALLKAPLIIGCDLGSMTDATKNILMNEEVIAVNQDSLGKQGKRIFKQDELEIYSGQLNDGIAVVLFNRSYKKQTISLDFQLLNLNGSFKIRDLIAKTDLGVFEKQFQSEVLPHEVIMIKIQS